MMPVEGNETLGVNEPVGDVGRFALNPDNLVVAESDEAPD
jgi:hypothetical protein